MGERGVPALTRLPAAGLVRAVAVLWAAFEVAAAIALRDRFTAGDWAALSAKLAFLAAAAASPACAAAGGSLAAAAVRLAAGWLSHTWYTVAAPLYSAATALATGRRQPIPLAIHAATAAAMAATLAGSLYQAPHTPPPEALAALPLGYAALAAAKPPRACAAPLAATPAPTAASWLAAH